MLFSDLQGLFERVEAELICRRTELIRPGSALRVRRELSIAAVGANPWSAYGWHFDPEKFITALRRALSLPVVNVKEEGL